MATEEEQPQDIVLTAAELAFKYKIFRQNKRNDELSEISNQLMAIYKEHNMIEFYKQMCNENEIKMDEELVKQFQAKEEALLKENDEAKKQAEQSEGDVEVHDIELKRGEILSKTSTLQNACKAYDSIKNLTTGKNIDKHLSMLRLCLAWKDDISYKKYSEVTLKLIDKGGDWDRRNRYTVYNGVYYFRVRDFKNAAKCFLDSIATFTATEIFDYKRLVYYTIISSVISLERVNIKKKLIDSPEIHQVIDELPILREFLSSFYECRYCDFFKALIELMKTFVRSDYYLNIHANYYLRHIRLRAYQQFLQSYRSVRLDSMAQAFGVSTNFLDQELSSFIASNVLSCKIDKVNGIVEMTRIDNRNAQYSDIIKKGDVVLNRMQRLSRVITY